MVLGLPARIDVYSTLIYGADGRVRADRLHHRAYDLLWTRRTGLSGLVALDAARHRDGPGVPVAVPGHAVPAPDLRHDVHPDPGSIPRQDHPDDSDSQGQSLAARRRARGGLVRERRLVVAHAVPRDASPHRSVLAVVGVLAFSAAARATSHVALLSTRANQPLSIVQLNLMTNNDFETGSVDGIFILLLTVGVAIVARFFGLRLGPDARR